VNKKKMTLAQSYGVNKKKGVPPMPPMKMADCAPAKSPKKRK
jgi:hypothetical protein